ncbi:MAG: hypothetical protein Q8M64_01775 [Methyloversatilis sp.]|nr:hypothetical protein [Methyloversatilis sp.]
MTINQRMLRHRVALAVALACIGAPAVAQPTFESASPTAGTSTSDRANESADKAMYKAVEYSNKNKKGPAVIVVPGEIKSNNATFTQKFASNNIADFGELELSQANFKVLERSDLGPLLGEFQLAYSMGDPDSARKMLQKGKFKTTKYVVKFDILKAEQVAAAKEGISGRAIGNIIGILGGSRGSYAAGEAVGSVETAAAAGVWIIGMRYKIIDANTTEQLAQGYTEEKMEVGAKGTSILGVSSSQEGGITLDGMVQRLVQKSVWEIDSKYK